MAPNIAHFGDATRRARDGAALALMRQARAIPYATLLGQVGSHRTAPSPSRPKGRSAFY
jgi:hypothetical protein